LTSAVKSGAPSKIASADTKAGGKAMTVTMTIEEAQANLKELIDGLMPGDEVVVTENQQPVAKLVTARPPQASGSCPSRSAWGS
jgi:di/tripeptidase